MTHKQQIFLGAWVLVGLVLVLGSALSAKALLVLFVVVAVIVSLFNEKLTPSNSSAPTPKQVIERSRLWRAVAVIYTSGLVAVVIYHLFINRLAFFDEIPFFLMLVMLLGPIIGPIVVCQIETFRLLGLDRDT